MSLTLRVAGLSKLAALSICPAIHAKIKIAGQLQWLLHLHYIIGAIFLKTTMSSSSNLTNISTQLTHPKFRADIDGVRAIAVLSVVGFHALNPQFYGM